MADLKTRDQVAATDSWDLTSMYADKSEWDVDSKWVAEQIPKIPTYKGKLVDAEQILACLKLIYDIERKQEKVYVYASLKHSEDLGDSAADVAYKLAQKQWHEAVEAGAFIAPELVKLEDAFLEELIANPDFADYKMYLCSIKRSKQYVLSDKEEALLAKAGNLWNGPYSIFGNFDNVDADFGKIDDGTGTEVQVTHGNYSSLLEKQDRSVRQNAFEAVYKEYEGHVHTLAEVLNLKVKQSNFLKDVRGYESSLVKALHGNAIDQSVYRNLIKLVHEQLPGFYKYVDKRKEMLGLDEIQMWDLRVPLMDLELKFTYDEAVDLVCAAAEPLGADYVEVMRKGLSGGWVDKYENKGKRSGAFSSGCYDSWPYILMNFEGSLNNVFTLMHEAGHSMHSYLANQNQSHPLADYPIFTAEIASTVNERLLTDYLLKTWEGDKRQAVLHYEIDGIRATFYRQTMFAEFELLIHETAASGQPLTKEFFCTEYRRLNDLYYGPGMGDDAYIQYEWARIPHFYYNFYVYQYATGIAAAYNFAERILQGEADQYLNLLKSGAKAYPLELLKEAGLDMTKTDFYGPIGKRFEELVGLM